MTDSAAYQISEAPAAAPERSLAELEGTIERGLATFIEVGQALMEIREHRLYRETHDSFETYCRERWGWRRAHAYRLMDAAEAAAIVSPIGDTPSNEAQARELARLKDEPEAVREVWSEVREAKGDKVTAADVRAAVDQRLGVPKPQPSPPQPAPPQEPDQPTETGGLCFECRRPIPPDAEACPSCAEPARRRVLDPEIADDYVDDICQRPQPPLSFDPRERQRAQDQADAEAAQQVIDLAFAHDPAAKAQVERLNFMLKYGEYVKATRELMALDPPTLALSMEDGDRAAFRRLVRDLRGWTDKVEGELSRPFRVISSGVIHGN